MFWVSQEFQSTCQHGMDFLIVCVCVTHTHEPNPCVSHTHMNVAHNRPNFFPVGLETLCFIEFGDDGPRMEPLNAPMPGSLDNQAKRGGIKRCP